MTSTRIRSLRRKTKQSENCGRLMRTRHTVWSQSISVQSAEMDSIQKQL